MNDLTLAETQKNYLLFFRACPFLSFRERATLNYPWSAFLRFAGEITGIADHTMNVFVEEA
ncbi:MAG: hypothetical protein KJ990_04905 [Proteobacteria bacterium]|nr:hypothetical protein [Pseudomonadota bacterium]MBU1650038.1 hypothetical protein [Pseudomonadota bacterium]